MNCPHCGGKVLSSQARWQRKMLAQGRCRTCCEGLDGPYQRCFRCRLRTSERQRQLYRQRHPQMRKFLKGRVVKA